MASLTGQLVAETYKALLKTIDNDILTASEKQITDGFGGGSNVFIDSQGFLRANKYKVTNGLATQFLKADGSLDSNTYLTGITSSQIIAALGYTPVTNARTLTINGTTYDLSANRSWTIEGTAAVWGNISGTLSNQTDLQTALNAKYNNPAGTISQYIRGDGSLATFPTLPGGLPTGGTAGQILSKIDSTDYNTHWIDNYATQTKNEVKLGATLAKGAAVYVSSANGTNMIVSAASNASEATSSKTLGLLETGGATNALVKCVTFGLLAGLDTSTAQAGDPVWLGINGALIFGLANKPYAPAHLVYIGVVTRVQQNNGEIFVNVQNGFELKEIHDVYIADPANNNGLFYDLADGLWKNKSIAGALGYTPQAQLNGTGFVKASGTTISYDNSTYLTTTDAASTYQLLTNLSTDLTASATKYPSVNAVIAGLDGKLNLSGGTLTGNLTISNANPKLFLTDTDNNPDYSIQNFNGTFKITDETNSADRFFIYSTGIGYYNGDFKANKLYVEGGTSSQFIKGDGTLDTNTYLTSASLDGYLAKAGGTMSGDLNFYTLKTTRVGGNAYIRGSWQGTYWGIGAAATGHTIIIDQVDFSTGAYESITDVNLMLGTRTVLHSGNYSSYALPITGGTVTGSITATSFVKSGGTASQFLMADGSVSTLSSPVTGSGSAGYIPKWTSASNVGSSNISDDGTSIGIAYTTPNKGGYGRTITGAAFGSASFGFEAVGGTTTNGGLVGGLSFILSQNDSSRIVGSAIQSNLVGTTATNYGADLRFFAKADAGVIGEVARMTSAGLRVYGTIVKDGGTSSQFLMADGSVSTGPNLSGYVPYTGATTNVNLGTNSLTATGLTINKNAGVSTITFPAGTNDPGFIQHIESTPNTGIMRFSVGDDNDSNDYFAFGNNNVPDAFRINAMGTVSIGVWQATAIADAYIASASTWNAKQNAITLTTTGSSGAATFTSNTLNIPNYGSALSGYLPLTGGTLTGTLNGTNVNTSSYSRFYNIGIGGAASGTYAAYSDAVIGFPNLHLVATTGAVYVNSALALPFYINPVGGNVMIGTATDAGYKLDINGTGRFSGNLQIDGSSYPFISIVGGNVAYGGGLKFFGSTTQYAEMYGEYQSSDNGQMFFRTRRSGSITNAMRISNTGELYVNTISSAYSSSGRGLLALNGSTNSLYAWSVNDVGKGYLYHNGTNVYIENSNSGGDFNMYQVGAGTITLNTNGALAMRVKSNGDIEARKSIFFGLDYSATQYVAISENQIYRSGGGILYINNSGSGSVAMVQGGGKLLVNTATDAGFLLDVNGSARIVGNINYSSSSALYPRTTSVTDWYLCKHNASGDRIENALGTNNPFTLGNHIGSTYTANIFLYGGGWATFNSSVTATAFFESSDIRLKTLIDGSAQILGIENLEAKLYEKNGKLELGYFAQDAEKLMPYAISKNADGFLNLSYREVHTAKIARLEQRVAELEKQLNLN